ncbi:hypothetical protein G9403_04235 [Weissella paramesenteroides]|uniref:Glycosyltransferase family 2 protein n=1 Tax=Weissella paramesenteroides TaxID=1249 RepID=A0ABD4XII6_WEIPA|nr:hypothetical protein [Weissella paramesenteroides]MDF8368739.1 hypothetical protein [Weissella paramesenteroides]MDF8370870.1 hypothetical protein [Weissella paramesenteroides]
MIEFVALVVTYGTVKRKENLISTIQSALTQGANKVFVLSNGVQYDIDLVLTSEFNNKVQLIKYEENLGSAAGFTGGLREIFNCKEISDDTFILILDDDVNVEPNFLTNLTNLEKSQSNTHVWSMLRLGRDHTFDDKTDKSINYYFNSIAGFTLKSRLFPLKKERENPSIAKMIFAPWAGIVLQKKLLKDIVLPTSDYFVYEDDSQFCLNLRKKNIQILKSNSLLLSEISNSWFEDKNKNSGYKIFYESKNDDQLGRFLYMIRNNVYLIRENKLVTNNLVYIFNILIFVVFGFLTYGNFHFKSFERLKLIIGAINDGWQGKLGKNVKWKL